MQFLAEVFLAIVTEYGVKAPGYMICRLFWKKDQLGVDHLKVAIAGLLFWASVAAALYACYGFWAAKG